MNDEARHDLEIVDAALRGAPLAAEHAGLAELVRALRASRPRPSEPFARELDARMAAGFGRRAPRPHADAGARRGDRGSTRGGRRAGWVTRPAFAAATMIVLAAAVVLPLTLSGGHGQRTERAASSAAEEPAPAVSRDSKHAQRTQTAASGGLGSAAGAAATGVRQIERSATLDVGVAASSVESKSHEVFSIVSAFNGYVRQSNVSSGGTGQGGASFDVRVPSANLAAAIAALSRLGHVRSENDATNDVTERVSSLQSALADLRAQQASLRRQLAATSDPQLAKRLKAELRSVGEHVSRLQGALGSLRQRAAYSALALTLTSEAGATSGAKNGELTPGAAARAAGRILEGALAVLVLVAATLLPLGAIALAGGALVAATRRRLRQQALDAS